MAPMQPLSPGGLDLPGTEPVPHAPFLVLRHQRTPLSGQDRERSPSPGGLAAAALPADAGQAGPDCH